MAARSEQESPAQQLERELAREERLRGSRRLTAFAVAASVLALGAAAAAVIVGLQAPKATDPALTFAKATAPAPDAVAPAPASVAVATDVEPSSTGLATPPVKAAPAKRPAATHPARAASAPRAASADAHVQRFTIAIGTRGYEPSRIVANSHTPIVLTVKKGEGCAAGFEIPSLHVRMDNSAGSASTRLGTLPAGTYAYSCLMGMVSGELVVR